MSSPNLDDALAFARAGWEVIPLTGKAPASAHGVKDATRDPERISAWWLRPHNIGARVPESLVVLDFDPRNGGSVAALEHAAGVQLEREQNWHQRGARVGMPTRAPSASACVTCVRRV